MVKNFFFSLFLVLPNRMNKSFAWRAAFVFLVMIFGSSRRRLSLVSGQAMDML